ncbi:MAG: hypothetical protein ACI8W8_002750 [Rhodothermales bacterium]|jgi:hypothetical protein
MKPDAVKSSVTEAQLASVLASRAAQLLSTVYPEAKRAASPCALYFSMAEALKPEDHRTIKRVTRLEQAGIETNLQKCLDAKKPLVPISELKPAVSSPATAPTPDQQLAHYAALLGASKLKANPKDADGLILLSFAGIVDPTNDVYWLAYGMLQRQITLPEAKLTKELHAFVALLVGRADYRMSRVYPKDKSAKNTCALYYAVAQHFPARDKNAIVGLTKLDLAGFETKLNSLLKLKLPSITRTIPTLASKSTPLFPGLSQGAASTTVDFKLDDLDEFKKHWRANAKFTAHPEGLKAPKGDNEIESLFTMRGDFEAEISFSFGQASYSNTGGTWIKVCGEQLGITNGWGGFGASTKVIRAGGTLTFHNGKKVTEHEIKPDIREKPSTFYLWWRSRNSHFKKLSVTAEEFIYP